MADILKRGKTIKDDAFDTFAVGMRLDGRHKPVRIPKRYVSNSDPFVPASTDGNLHGASRVCTAAGVNLEPGSRSVPG